MSTWTVYTFETGPAMVKAAVLMAVSLPSLVSTSSYWTDPQSPMVLEYRVVTLSEAAENVTEPASPIVKVIEVTEAGFESCRSASGMVAVRHGSSMVTVKTIFSESPDGVNVVEPAGPLFAMVKVLPNLTS